MQTQDPTSEDTQQTISPNKASAIDRLNEENTNLREKLTESQN